MFQRMIQGWKKLTPGEKRGAFVLIGWIGVRHVVPAKEIDTNDPDIIATSRINLGVLDCTEIWFDLPHSCFPARHWHLRRVKFVRK